MEDRESGDWDGNEIQYNPPGLVATFVMCGLVGLLTLGVLFFLWLWVYSHYAT